jgi:predicted Ser/Thr protein kinase
MAERLPNLDVLELLGCGGMGIVYQGRKPFLDRLVAIKVFRPDLKIDGASQERFLREGRALAKLRHPFIGTVFDVHQAGDLYCLVMEYVEGTSLRQLLQEGNGSITHPRTQVRSAADPELHVGPRAAQARLERNPGDPGLPAARRWHQRRVDPRTLP